MNSFLKLCILTVVAGLWAAPVLAQPKAAETKPKQENKSKESPWTRKLPEVQFDNIPLTEVANYLGDLFPEINFVVHANVASTPVLLRLRSVTLDDIFTALEICLKNTGAPIDNGPGVPISAAAVQITKVNERMVSFTESNAATGVGEKPVCRAFSLSRYLAGKNDDETAKELVEIQGTLKICWMMMAGANPGDSGAHNTPQLSIHRGTKILIIIGQPEQVDIVAQVVSQLNGEPIMAGYPGQAGALPGWGLKDHLARRPGRAADANANPFVPGIPGNGPTGGTSPSQNTPPPGK